MPVFPLVGSIITLSFFNIPFASASSIIAKAILSLMLAPGLFFSNFIHTSCSLPNNLLMRTCAVFPIVSRMLFTFIFIFFFKKLSIIYGCVRDCSGNPFCSAGQKDCSGKPGPQGTPKYLFNFCNTIFLFFCYQFLFSQWSIVKS